MSTPLSAQKRAAILSVTSKEWMLEHVSKFDESWVAGMRLMTGRAHPSIAREAPKVRTDKEANVDNVDSGRIDEAFEAYNAQIWADRVMPITGHARYIDMANDICSKHNLPPLLD